MSEQLEKEIVEELKRINERLDRIEQSKNFSKGLTPATKIAAIILGFLVIGPVILIFISIFSPMIQFLFS